MNSNRYYCCSNEDNAIKTLVIRKISYDPFSGIAENGERTKIWFKDGTRKSGYVGYDTDFGGFFMYHSHKSRILTKKNVFTIDPSKIAHIRPANRHLSWSKEDCFDAK